MAFVFVYDPATGKQVLADVSVSQAFVLPAPAMRTNAAGNNFKEIGTVVYPFATYDPKTIKAYTFWLDHATADTIVEIRRESDGVLVATTTVGAPTGLKTIDISASLNLPVGDDALYVQFKKSGGGSGSTIVAGDFVFA